MLPSRVLSVFIDRPWAEVYEAIWRPETFPKWASGLSRSSLRKEGDVWHADGPAGPVRIRFTGHNAFGVMDHYVHVDDTTTVYVPLRVLENGNGTEVQLTLFRLPTMSDDDYRKDAATVEQDLQALKKLVTTSK